MYIDMRARPHANVKIRCRDVPPASPTMIMIDVFRGGDGAPRVLGILIGTEQLHWRRWDVAISTLRTEVQGGITDGRNNWDQSA